MQMNKYAAVQIYFNCKSCLFYEAYEKWGTRILCVVDGYGSIDC